jgi:hypothetical protein
MKSCVFCNSTDGFWLILREITLESGNSANLWQCKGCGGVAAGIIIEKDIQRELDLENEDENLNGQR